MKFKIGVDIGGTFTDTTVLTDDGQVTICKTPSTPETPDASVLAGVQLAMTRAGVSPADCSAFVNSSTVGLNAIVERKGARVGFLVTRGFEDLLEIGRAKISDPFSFLAMRPIPLIRRNLVRGVDERIDFRGGVLQPLNESQLLAAARELVGQQVEAIAILFLHAYRNPVNEQAAKKRITEAFPGIDVAISTEVWPQIREFERATVLVMNSYIAPKVSKYIKALDERKSDAGLQCALYVSGSNGGIMPSDHAADRPITSILSGPSAGIVATINLMQASSLERAIALDMGGTSADICVLTAPMIPYASGQEIEGLPIAVPYVDISSIGAGGGSIAYPDGGLLRVGPQSAGATPGPAAYDKGGMQPTLTDAYVVSGFIDADNLLGGEVRLSADLAATAVAELGRVLRLGVNETAAGIVRVTTSNLAAEFTRLMAKKGIDSREFALVAFGGAGPTHACLLADELQIRRIAVPVTPGTFCALGSVLADFRLDYLETVYASLQNVAQDRVDDWVRTVQERAARILGATDPDTDSGQIALEQTADVRYVGQGYEVPIPFKALSSIPERFRSEYARLYGPRTDDPSLEIINLRATAVKATPKPRLAWARGKPESTASRTRRTFWEGKWQENAVFDRKNLISGWKNVGPFLVDQLDTTVVVTKGWRAQVDDFGTLHLQKDH